MLSCNVSSVQNIPSDDITEAASPDGDREFFRKKLANNSVVVTAAEMEHSIPYASSRLFSITWAFKLFEHLKNSVASVSYSGFVTIPTLDATSIIFWSFTGIFLNNFVDFLLDRFCN